MDRYSEAQSVSGDGFTLVGNSCSTLVPTGAGEPCRWVGNSPYSLGMVAGGTRVGGARSCTHDGSVIVGWTATPAPRAFIWDASHGMRLLSEVLTNDYGISLAGWVLEEAFAITPDGSVIVGIGRNPSNQQEGWIARLAPTMRSFCFGDSAGAPCPCGNTGLPGHGCEHSFGLGGARLTFSGAADLSADTLRFIATTLPPTTTALFFQGDAIIPGGQTPFGDGLRCASGAIVRLGTRSAEGGSAAIGAGTPASPPIHDLGQIPTSGGTRYYQVWYRNNVTFCTPSAFNLSNGLIANWVP